MKGAYALLGLLFLIIVVAALVLGTRSVEEEKEATVTDNETGNIMTNLTLTSPVFPHEGAVPSKYTCDGERTLNPPLEISGVPESAKSLVLIMDDPDVPRELKADGVFDHWILFNIAPNTVVIEEGESPGVIGVNARGENGYTGPCPPPQYEPAEHRYFFKLYALDTALDLPEGASRADVERVMEGHVLEEAELMGRYERK